MYRGKTADLPCGTGGLDGNQNVYQVPISRLIKARNIRYDGLCWRKAPGLVAFGTSSISNTAICMAGTDWKPTVAIQRQITAWSDGSANATGVVYKEVGGVIDQVELANSLVMVNPVTMVEGGFEDAGEDRKLYIYSKDFAPLVLNEDDAALTAITNSSADWSVTYPASAVYHDARIYAFGVDSAPHNFYISSLSDHGDFASGDSRVYQIAPGRGEYIAAAYSYLPNELLVFKYPAGIWSVETSDVTGFYLPINKVRDDVGMAGPHGICKVEQDIVFISSNGRLYSLTALRSGVDPQNADVTAKLRMTEFIKTYVDASKLKYARLVYDEIRKELHYIFTSRGSASNNMEIVLDLNEDGNPKIAIEDRGEFFSSVWRRIADNGFSELMCAGADGTVRRMNIENRSIDGDTPYIGELQYPDTDFDFIPMNVYKPFPVGSVRKRFDFLEITVLPTGNYDMSVEFIVDGRSVKTSTFNLGSDSEAVFDTLDDTADPPEGFDYSTFGGQLVFKHRIPIEASGNMLGLRMWNSGLNEDFKIVNLRVFFKPQGNEYEA